MNDSNRTGPHLPATVDDGGTDQPQSVGRYRIEKVLGKGGFGVVYLARDEQLQRFVAIKVPHPELVSRPEDAEAYLTEARTVAGLDHPNIVTVHDVGGTLEFPFFVVSKYVEGSDLKRRLKEARPSVLEAVELTATVAETLHFAHRQGLVHRDIKPGNILLDKSGKPYVADFGLALKEENIGKGPRFAGTPTYMSPEQARGEGHRVDGRSDIFSLGIVFYEMLTGRRPFAGQTRDEVLDQITSLDARPLRQWDDTIPKELERICLKALAKRAADRYLTAKDMADDLRSFLEQSTEEERAVLRSSVSPAGENVPGQITKPLPSPLPTPGSDSEPIKIVPKGLRSFDAGDADFFLELLPGPRDRGGLPDSIRFWKTRIEATEADSTFAVGLIYGPSGCGKSSLMKAGLLPRLAKTVLPIYIEATAEETEARLLKGLRRQLPDLPSNISLIDALSSLRQGRFLKQGRKVLIVLDQFEQWLHAKRGEENTELVQALRHCDGGRVQCVVMVRDDFWLAVSRFMQALEIRLVEAENSRLVDLFDPRHARKVLTAFGRAFGTLPEKELANDQQSFLDHAVAGLAEDGKVISVRLALFAEMVKGKPWTPATLKEVGGIEGVGVTFLEETFAASTAPPQHRLHQKAAQAVLKALLPESGTDIKGHMRSQQELLQAAGYAGHPSDFDDLIRILDSEIRLITPTDPEGKESCEPGVSPLSSDTRYYQLTHDYLVPSLRDWLTRKQKETRRGRAELLLADRAAVWNARPENRQLPSLPQWLSIRWLTRKKNWTPPQRKMMGKATGYHALRASVLTLVLLLMCWGLWEGFGYVNATAHVRELVAAETVDVERYLKELPAYDRWAGPQLLQHAAESNSDLKARLHASLALALLHDDDSQLPYLRERMLAASPDELVVLRDLLHAQAAALEPELWKVLGDGSQPRGRRFRAAGALAAYTPEDARWQPIVRDVADWLVRENPYYLRAWTQAFKPARAVLLEPLREVFHSTKSSETERTLATSLLADYAADQPQLLANLLMDADEKQFAELFPKFKETGEKGLPLLTGEIDRKLPPDAKDDAKETLAKRQANAAVALLRMNQPAKVWPLLQHSPDPRVRSYLIHRLSPLGADAKAIVKQLEEEKEISIRRALILSLGEFAEKDFTPDERKSLLEKLQESYRTEADPGLHASVEWLLRRWKKEAWLKQVNDGWAMDKEQREKRVESIQQSLTKVKEKTPPQWYVNGQGQTMVVIPGPVEFSMGSPPSEAGRAPSEQLHRHRIGRTFAIATTPVTVEQFRRFLTANPETQHQFDLGGQAEVHLRKYSPEENCPIVIVSWYMAAEYCNWLSKEEDIAQEEWCYEPETTGAMALVASTTGFMGSISGQGPLLAASSLIPGRTASGQYYDGMRLKRDYLRRTGYRLPMEAEWEYACRARAVTSRYYGESEALLGEYARYQPNGNDRTGPVGGKKPIDLGLFDMYGNVWNWCQDEFMTYPKDQGGKLIEDKGSILIVNGKASRVLRGGAFSIQASDVRSAIRYSYVPTNRMGDIGFRPSRTFTP